MKVILLTVVAALALAVAGTGTAAPTSQVGCSDVGYLTYALRAAKQNLAAWKAVKREAYGTAIVYFKKARYNVSSGPIPCEYQYLKHRRYAIEQYDDSVRYAQAMRQGRYDDAEYWMDEIDTASDLAAIWMD